MIPSLSSFSDELIKLGFIGGAIGGAGKFLMKRPMLALGLLPTIGFTAYATNKAYKEGLQMGERPRYIEANSSTPSDAFFTNYHELFPHDLSSNQKKQISNNLKPELLKR